MKYTQIGFLKVTDSNYRQRGGRWKNNTHLTGRRMWMKDGVKRSSMTGYDPEDLTTLENAVYTGIAPEMSSFALLEEACILYAPAIEGENDPRHEGLGQWFHPKSKGHFGNPNHGQAIYTVGLKKYHGDGCDCIECVDEEDYHTTSEKGD